MMQNVLLQDVSAFTNPPSTQQKQAEVTHLYAEAELLLKQAERINSGVPIPLINELRYAGSHLSRYLLEKDAVKADEDIQKAKNHCERAIFDAYEIMVIYYLDNFKYFNEQFGKVSLSDTIPDYFASRKTIREARDFVTKYTCKDDRVQYCVQAKGYLEKLKTLWETYDDAREEIAKKMKKERFQVLLTIFGIMIGVVGAFATAYKVFVQ